MVNVYHRMAAIVLVGAVCTATTAVMGTELTLIPRKSTKSLPKPAAPSATVAPKIKWLANYSEAMKQAELGRKMLLVYFYDQEGSENQALFEDEALADPKVRARLAKEYVAVRVPTDYETNLDGDAMRLIDHEAFIELHGRAGAAIIDFANDDEAVRGFVVSVLPFSNGKYFRFDPEHLLTMVDLPAGTLTQRTMIFAVRIHPEAPKSTLGRPNRTLFGEAHDHSRYQARIRSQGHHNWGSRFQRITGLLPSGLHAQEVVAQSWPGEGLVDAAIDCVHSWRQSSGHWSAVRSAQPHFGYDIKKGQNGIWYATGLFGNSE